MPTPAARPRRRPLLALVALAAVGWAVMGGAGLGAPPPGGRDPAGLIAFVDGYGQLAVVDVASAAVTAFGSGPGRAVFPAWSSDGARVAAVVVGQAGVAVEVVDVARGAGPTVVLAAPDRVPIYLYWSPDDRYLAVLSNTPGSTLALDIVDVARALSSDPAARSTLAFGQPFYWVWSPTGRAVVVHRDVLGEAALVGLTSVDSFAVASPLPSPGAFQAPDVSDSGRFVAYAARDALGERVVVVGDPERGGGARTFAQLEGEDLMAFAWRPGREQLSVQGATLPGYFVGPVVLLDAESGEARVVSEDLVVASFWSPDGRWLATLSLEAGGEDGPVVEGGPARVQGRLPLLSLRFVDVDGLTAVDAGTFPLTPAFLSQYLPFFDQYSRSHRLWSPDSTALVLPVVGPTGAPTLVVVGVDGTSATLAPGDMPAWNVR